jgi:hypothetical protein
MNVSLSLENKMANMWYPLEPKFNIYQLNEPYKISGNIAIPKPIISTIAHWLDP